MGKIHRQGLAAAIGILAAGTALAQPVGTNWRFNGPGSLSVGRFSVAVDPIDPDLVYLGSRLSPAFYVSSDGGKTWRSEGAGIGYASPDPSSKTLFKPRVEVVAIDPFDRDTIYLGTSDGLFRRKNPSEPWVKVVRPQMSAGVQSIAFCASHPNVMYLGSKHDGIHKTTDGGQTWTKTPGIGFVADVYSLFVDPNDPDVAVAVDTYTSVRKTTDGGENWYWSIDGLFDGSILPDVYDLVRHTTQPKTFYIATDKGIYRSTDGAESWVEIRDGYFREVALDPANPQRIYAVDNDGRLHKSVDGGAVWTLGPLVAWPDAQIAVAPSASNVLYLAKNSDISKSVDGGTTFEGIGSDLGRVGLTGLATSPGKIFAGSFFHNGLHRSETSGDGWEIVSDGLPNADAAMDQFATDAVDPDTVFAGGEAQKGVYKSTNGGDTWGPSNTGLPANCTVEVLAAHPLVSGTVYAGIYPPGIYKSVDAGGHWTPAQAGLPAGQTISFIAINPAAPSVLYAATFDSNAYQASVSRSSDGGASWTPASTGLPDETTINGLVMTPGVVWAGTGKGLYRRADSGGSWTPVLTGLPANAYVGPLAYDSGSGAGRYLGAATGVGIYTIDISSAPPALYVHTSTGISQSVDGGATFLPFSRGLSEGLKIPDVWALAVGRQRLGPETLVVDAAAGPGSNGNGIFEPGETVSVQTSWKNLGSSPLTVSGRVSDPNAPLDGTAVYGTIAAGASRSCAASNDCYSFFAPYFSRENVSGHIDYTFTEALSVPEAPKAWSMHMGDSFLDVPKTHPFYRKIETVFHNGITVGCANSSYCASAKVPRDQMAIFLARGLARGGD
ncbi:MAG TPA: hypothetical protein VIB08_10805, partial [Thermoanaerobaculia bacterium]